MLDAVYVVCEGEMELLTSEGSRTRPVRPPEDYGLVSLVEPRRVVQSNRAVTPTRLVKIPADALHVLMDSDQSIGPPSGGTSRGCRPTTSCSSWTAGRGRSPWTASTRTPEVSESSPPRFHAALIDTL